MTSYSATFEREPPLCACCPCESPKPAAKASRRRATTAGRHGAGPTSVGAAGAPSGIELAWAAARRTSPVGVRRVRHGEAARAGPAPAPRRSSAVGRSQLVDEGPRRAPISGPRPAAPIRRCRRSSRSRSGANRTAQATPTFCCTIFLVQARVAVNTSARAAPGAPLRKRAAQATDRRQRACRSAGTNVTTRSSAEESARSRTAPAVHLERLARPRRLSARSVQRRPESSPACGCAPRRRSSARFRAVRGSARSPRWAARKRLSRRQHREALRARFGLPLRHSAPTSTLSPAFRSEVEVARSYESQPIERRSIFHEERCSKTVHSLSVLDQRHRLKDDGKRTAKTPHYGPPVRAIHVPAVGATRALRYDRIVTPTTAGQSKRDEDRPDCRRGRPLEARAVLEHRMAAISDVPGDRSSLVAYGVIELA